MITYIAHLTGIDITRLARGISWLFANQVVSSMAGFLLTVVLANILSETDFGTYKYLVSIVGMAGVVAFTGISTALVRSVARGYSGEMTRQFRRSLVYNIGVGICALGFAGYYLYSGNTILGYGSLVIAITTPLTITYGLFASYLNGSQHYRSYAISGMVYGAIPTLLVIGIAYTLTTSILILFTIFMVSQLLLAISLYYVTLWYIPPNQKLDSEALHFGTHLSFMNVLGNFTFQLDRFLAWHLIGPVALAIYSIAIAPPQQLRYFNKIISTIALPRFSKHSVQTIKRTMSRKLVVSFLFGLALVIPYWLAAPFIFEIFFPKYTHAVAYSQMFSLVILFFPGGLLQEALKAHAHTNVLYILHVGIPLVKITLLLIFIPLYGLWGIIYTVLILEIIRLVISLFAFYTIPTIKT